MQPPLLKRTVDPELTPVTLAECKADLRVQHSAEDDLIESLILAATDYMDVPNGAIGKALMPQTWALSVPHADRMGRVRLPITPVKSIEAITYFDADDAVQSLDVSDFYLYGDEDRAWLEPKLGVAWPTTFSRLDAITVTFVAGFGEGLEAADAVPKTIRQAIRMLVVHWYENRGAAVIGTISSELPIAVQSLINLNRKGWVA